VHFFRAFILPAAVLFASLLCSQQQQTKPVRDFSDDEAQPAAATQGAPTPATPAATQLDKNAPPADSAAAPSNATPKPAAASPAAQAPSAAMNAKEQEMRQIAERFAPVFYQRLAGDDVQRTFDYPTNFDFDGDWIGTNNWAHAEDPKYKHWGYIYYSAEESESYYFLHYAIFHPRDWSLVQKTYDGLLDTLQAIYKDQINKQSRDEVEFNHENDLEGVLVIVDKRTEGGPQVVAAESVAHDHLLAAITERAEGLHVTVHRDSFELRLDDGRPVFYVESQKHGIHPYEGQQATAEEPIIVMRYGKPTEFHQVKDGQATYELISIAKTFFTRARQTKVVNDTFGAVKDYGDSFCQITGAQKPSCNLGAIGVALHGEVARPNAAQAPWGWVDLDDKELPFGSFFFDPLTILRRHFGQHELNERYLYEPYLGIGGEIVIPAATATPPASSKAPAAATTPAVPAKKVLDFSDDQSQPAPSNPPVPNK
jgi:hypothetical protein